VLIRGRRDQHSVRGAGVEQLLDALVHDESLAGQLLTPGRERLDDSHELDRRRGDQRAQVDAAHAPGPDERDAHLRSAAHSPWARR
jgi:hypothetical protein